MAYHYQANKSPVPLHVVYPILAALVLLFIGNAPLGHGQQLGLGINAQINITGTLFCTATGNPAPGASGVAGVRVNATCGGVSVGTAITNVAGIFNISVNASINGTLSLLINNQCSVTVALPVTTSSNCTALPATGVLTSIPSLASVTVTSLGVIVVEFVAGVLRLL